ncbi:DUF427 domain-containing protein [Sinomonas halotolerans]|uniref:DUF427 domain-containing protein n=1 Tax=Sinomonas halotolerans TaxID=1644133 RepID=A0ABU9WXV9_9MICC
MAVELSRELRRLSSQLRFERHAKRLRAELGDAPVLDSRRAVVLWEPQRHLPVHAAPEDDVVARLEAFTPPGPDDAESPPDRTGPPSSPLPFSPHTADGERLTVAAGAHRAPDAAFRLADPDLAGYIAFDTDSFTWREEDEPVIGHPRDPLSRIDIRASSAHVRVLLDGVVLADSHRTARLFESRLPPRTYFPREDIRWEALEPDPLRTVCPYKGTARYWSAPGLGDGRPVAWSYGSEMPEMVQIHERVAFFDERTDVELDGVPQPHVRTAWS